MKSMTARMTAGYALAVTGAVVVALATGRWLLEREMIGGLSLLHEAEHREVVQQLHGAPATMPEAELVQRMQEHAVADEHLFFFQVHDAGGRVIFRSATLGETMLPDLPSTQRHWTMLLPPHGRVHTSEFTEGQRHFQIATRLEPMEILLGNYTRISVGLTGFVALASLGLGYGISRLALRPIRDIERTARRIGADNLSERIPVTPGRDELAQLARLLNAMFDRLESSFRQVAQFSADASHELKTPLTLIRLNAERLRTRLAENPAAVAAVEDLLEEITQMNRMIERLLFLAKAESGALTLTREPHATDAFLAAVAEDAAVLAEDRGVRLKVERSEPGTVPFDRGLMRQVLLNLVSNAVSVMPGGGEVGLRSYFEAGRWHMEVRDEGPGLPAEQLGRLFERFVQLPRPAGATVTGSGLGLAICRGIARRHGGEVTAANRSDRSGLCVTVELPAEG
jgi:signal transduction histidine kinase